MFVNGVVVAGAVACAIDGVVPSSTLASAGIMGVLQLATQIRTFFLFK